MAGRQRKRPERGVDSPGSSMGIDESAFAGLASQLLEQVESDKRQNDALARARTRDLILPKLISGDVRVLDVEKSVGALP